jgi:hypothetical protein
MLERNNMLFIKKLLGIASPLPRDGPADTQPVVFPNDVEQYRWLMSNRAAPNGAVSENKV